jgi:hypothetical protein
VASLHNFVIAGFIIVGHMLEELSQASDQLVAAAYDMQSALVLMLFQDLVQSVFEFAHDDILFREGNSTSTKLASFSAKRKFEILMTAI